MSLTTKQRTTGQYDKFPAAQLFIIALVRVAEPIAITSIFPYAWKLVLDFQFGNKSNASFYAGILISAFSFAESITGMYWGGLSDRVGRKPVLLLGCAGTMLSLLIVGLSTNFWVALFGRCIGGALNGNAGVIQTMVGEVTVNPKHEPRAYAVMPFVWSIGTILGPSVGGYFANPAENFPSSFSAHGIFGTFPYLLPNLICATMMLLSIIAGYFLLEETHPDLRPEGFTEDESIADATTSLISTQVVQAGTTTAAADLRIESYGTFSQVIHNSEENWNLTSDGRLNSILSESEKVFTKRVVMLVIALGIFTYHSMTYDHLFPIFAETERATSGDLVVETMNALSGGLGLSIQQVGVIISINGLIALFIQAVIFPLVTSWLGVWKVFMLVTIFHPIVFVIVPYLVILPSDWLYTGVYTCLSVRNLFGILAYPTILILLKEACPSSSALGRINGLAASTGAACRTIASPLAGLLYSIGISIDFTALAWWASALIAFAGTIQVFFINRKKDGDHHQIRAPAPCRFIPAVEPINDVVHIHINDDQPTSLNE